MPTAETVVLAITHRVKVPSRARSALMEGGVGVHPCVELSSWYHTTYSEQHICSPPPTHTHTRAHEFTPAFYPSLLVLAATALATTNTSHAATVVTRTSMRNLHARTVPKENIKMRKASRHAKTVLQVFD